MNALSTLPRNEYVTLRGNHGERVIGMRMSDGNFLVRDGDVVGHVSADAAKGWGDEAG